VPNGATASGEVVLAGSARTSAVFGKVRRVGMRGASSLNSRLLWLFWISLLLPGCFGSRFCYSPHLFFGERVSVVYEAPAIELDVVDLLTVAPYERKHVIPHGSNRVALCGSKSLKSDDLGDLVGDHDVRAGAILWDQAGRNPATGAGRLTARTSAKVPGRCSRP
jgi:hypothetical protein